MLNQVFVTLGRPTQQFYNKLFKINLCSRARGETKEEERAVVTLQAVICGKSWRISTFFNKKKQKTCPVSSSFNLDEVVLCLVSRLLCSDVLCCVVVSSRGLSPPVPAVRDRIQSQQAPPSSIAPPPPPVQEFIPYVRTHEVFNLDPLEPADTPPPHTHTG